MKHREEIIGNCRLILGDCLDVMPTLGKVDAVVTDPPYGVLDESWDDMNDAELAAFTMRWLGTVASISEDFITFFGQRTKKTVFPLLNLLRSDIRQIIWRKGGGAQADHGFFYSYESAYLCGSNRSFEVVVPKYMEVAAAIKSAREKVGLSRGGVDLAVRGKKTGLCFRWEEGCCLPTDEQIKILEKAIGLNGEFFEALTKAKDERDINVANLRTETKARAADFCDVLDYPVPHGKQHPTEKPIGLMQDLISGYLKKSETILDPFMGSGTTGVACAKLGRKFIGIELEPKYFDIACRRIEEAYKQPDLFIPAPVNHTQPDLLEGDA